MMSLFVTIPEDCHLVIDDVNYAGRQVYRMLHEFDGTGSFEITERTQSGDLIGVGQKTIYMNEAQNKQVMIAFCLRQIDYLKKQLEKEKSRLLELSNVRLLEENPDSESTLPVYHLCHICGRTISSSDLHKCNGIYGRTDK